MRIGKIVSYNEITGEGILSDTTYYERTYKFYNKGYMAGQIVNYETVHINPISGFRVARVISPKLWQGYTDQDVDSFIKSNQNLMDDLEKKNKA